MIGIYKIVSPTDKVYIGQSHSIEKRFIQYKNLHCKDQRRIFNSLKKHGVENHLFEPVLIFPFNICQPALDEYEQLFMDRYKKLGYELMNLKDGGSRGLWSEESKKLASDRTKGKPRPWLKGKKLSAERVEQIRISAKNQVRTAEFCLKISLGIKKYNMRMGRNPRKPSVYKYEDGKFPTELKERYSQERSGELNHYYGKKHSDEVRLKMSNSNKGNKVGLRNGRARSINQYSLSGEFIKKWDTINQAALALNISRQSINCAVVGRNKTAHGFIWEYTENNKTS